MYLPSNLNTSLFIISFYAPHVEDTYAHSATHTIDFVKASMANQRSPLPHTIQLHTATLRFGTFHPDSAAKCPILIQQGTPAQSVETSPHQPPSL